MSHTLFMFVLCTGNNEIIKYVNICYFYYLKRILNDDSLKKYINPVVFIDLKYMLKYMYKLKVICFNCLPLKYML